MTAACAVHALSSIMVCGKLPAPRVCMQHRQQLCTALLLFQLRQVSSQLYRCVRTAARSKISTLHATTQIVLVVEFLQTWPRYMYQETLGRWHAIDLFFGLAYLSRRGTEVYPAADIAAAGRVVNTAEVSPEAAQEMLLELQRVQRYMLYCQGLRHHKAELQRKHWHDLVGTGGQEDTPFIIYLIISDTPFLSKQPATRQAPHISEQRQYVFSQTLSSAGRSLASSKCIGLQHS